MAKSQSENSEGVLFLGKRLDGEARRGRIPAAVSDRGATKPAGLFRENPPGDGSFACVRRWLGRHSPLWGCSDLSVLATAKIPHRRTPRNFQTGSLQVRLTAGEAEKLLLANGFIWLRSKGSHRIYLKGVVRIVVPFHGRRILHPKIAKQIFSAVGLE